MLLYNHIKTFLFLLLSALLVIWIVPSIVEGQEASQIPEPAVLFLNELYPAPLNPPSGDGIEWVEIYNSGESDVRLDNYSVKDASGKKLNLIATSVPAHGYVLATASGVLNNDGDTVKLIDALGTELDVATYSAVFDSVKSYARCKDGANAWIAGTPSKQGTNPDVCATLTPTSIPTNTPTPITSIGVTPSISTTQTSPTPTTALSRSESTEGVIISEVLSYPEGGGTEWVELHNNGAQNATLENWRIDDIAGGGSPQEVSLVIPADGYAVIEIDGSLFNNAGDSVRLLTETGSVQDEHSFLAIPRGQSWGKDPAGTAFCIQHPSPAKPNLPCVATTDKTPAAVATTPTRNQPTPKLQQTQISSYQEKKPPSANLRAYRSTPLSTRNVLDPTPEPYSSRVFSLTTEPPSDTPKPLAYLSLCLSLLAMGSVAIRMRESKTLWPARTW